MNTAANPVHGLPISLIALTGKTGTPPANGIDSATQQLSGGANHG
jgi:hypothetical protein